MVINDRAGMFRPRQHDSVKFSEKQRLSSVEQLWQVSVKI